MGILGDGRRTKAAKEVPVKNPPHCRPFHAIIQSEQLSAHAKALYVLLLTFADKLGKCRPGKAKLAKMLCCGVRSISRSLRELKNLNIVSWDRGSTGIPNSYIVSDLPVAFAMSPKHEPRSMSPIRGRSDCPTNYHHKTAQQKPDEPESPRVALQ